jgi:hypothetical protein
MKSKGMQKGMERNFTRMGPVLLKEKREIENSVGICKIRRRRCGIQNQN